MTDCNNENGQTQRKKEKKWTANELPRCGPIMKREGIDYYYIPTADFHESEYVVEYFKARKFITGFTGSAGVAVIGQEECMALDRRTLLYSGGKPD